MMSKYTIIDLFSGAGGLSYGFEMAGCEVKLAIEKDAWAVETYKANHKNQNVFALDITTLPDDYFLSYKGKIDIVMGGPPFRLPPVIAAKKTILGTPCTSIFYGRLH